MHRLNGIHARRSPPRRLIAAVLQRGCTQSSGSPAPENHGSDRSPLPSGRTMYHFGSGSFPVKCANTTSPLRSHATAESPPRPVTDNLIANLDPRRAADVGAVAGREL